ncbi:phage baseplate assembly protein domain-containing protein, partial [Acinetobacter chengduensis]
ARGGSKLLQLTGFAGEVLDETELVQQVGFSSYIPDGCRVVVIPLQGKTSRSIVIATDGAPIVVEVSEGETCIYDQHGHSVWLKKDGTYVEGDLFVNGKVQATGDVIDQKSSMQEMRDIYDSHKHGNSPTPDKPM